MVKENLGLEDLKTAMTGAEELLAAVKAEKEAVSKGDSQGTESAKSKVDALGRAYGTGRRKDAVARVWIKPGSGKMVVNGRESQKYFARPVLQMILNQPFVAIDRENQFDIFCSVMGGGLSGQAGAVRHGISRALICFDPNLRSVLKVGGFLTRDSRVVERKKYGHKKARKSFQFSKR